jgi:hypothetical protein
MRHADPEEVMLKMALLQQLLLFEVKFEELDSSLTSSCFICQRLTSFRIGRS